MDDLVIREAEPGDVPQLMALLKELAAWERLSDRFQLTGDQLSRALFETRAARAVIAHVEGEPAAAAIFYPHFATFAGAATLYMEELIVSERFRSRGVGRAMILYLARLALDEGFFRLEWPVMLDNPSALRFYEKLGAQRLTDRVGFRLSREALQNLTGEDA